MKKLLLLLFVIICGFSLQATEITITPADTRAVSTSNSYVTSYTKVTASNFDFMFNQCGLGNAQMKVGATSASGFNMYNATSIPNIKKVVVKADASTLGTWYMKTDDKTAISSSSATTSDIAGVTSGQTVTFTVPDNKTANYFHINLTSKGSGVVKFTSIVITYGDDTDDSNSSLNDKITANSFSIDKATTYTDVEYTSSTTGITYKGNVAKTSTGSDAGLQLNSNNNIGVVVTQNKNGYFLKQVKVDYKSGSNTLDIYAKTSTYTSAADLFNTSSSVKGTKIKSFSSTDTYDVDTSKKYTSVGFRSNSGAIYLNSIEFVWVKEGEENDNPQTFTATFKDIEMTVGDANVELAPVSTTPSTGDLPKISYTISEGENTVIKFVDGKVHAVAKGDAKITASWGDDKTWKVGSTTFKVTVNPASTVDPEPTPGEETEWVLLKDINELKAGDEIVIIGDVKGGTYGLSNQNQADYRPQTKEIITINTSGNKVTAAITDEVMIFKVDYTTDVSGYPYTLKTVNYGTNGYIGNLGSAKNNCTISSELKAGYYASISLDSSYDAIITFNGTGGDYNTLKYNSASNATRFACYTSDQKPIQIFKKTAVTLPEPSKPTLSINGVAVEGESMTVAKGTRVTLDCENATSWSGYVGNVEIDNEPVPYTFTVDEETYIYVVGVNSAGESEEELEFTFYVGEVDENMPKVGSNFRQLLNNEEITEDYYVIGRHYNSETNPVHVAMSTSYDEKNSRIDSTVNIDYVDGIPTTVSFDKEKGDVVKDKEFTLLTTKGKDVLIVRLEKNTEGQWGIRTVNYGDGFKSSQKYISNSSENKNAIVLVDEFTPATIEVNQKNNVNISFYNGAGYSIGTPTSGAYFNYQASGGAIQLYRHTEAELFVPEFDDIVLKEGTSTTITPKNESYPDGISYRVKSNTTLIKIVDGNTVQADERQGKAVIVASWDETKDGWFAGRTEINVTVKKDLNDDEFFFRHALVRGKVDVGVAAQAVYYAGTGTVTYSIDGTGINLNSETGMIRPEDLIAPILYTDENPFVYTVTASVGETDEHIAKTATYTIRIEAPDAITQEKSEATFDFTDPNKYGLFKFTSTPNNYQYNPGSGNVELYEKNLNQVNPQYSDREPVSKLNADGSSITLTLDGNYRNWLSSNTAETSTLRVYKEGKLTFDIGNAGGINKIEIEGASLNKIKLDDNQLGAFSTASNNTIGIWTAPEDKNVTSITFVYTETTSFSTINSINLDLSVSSSSSLPESELAFNDNRIINMFVGDEMTLPVLSHNKALTFDQLTFDIDEINEMDEDETFTNYIIDGIDFDNINVRVFVPGVYTFRAYNVANKYVLGGMAILRLNVFPRLSVMPHEDSDNTLADDTRNESPSLTIVHATPDTEGNQTATIALPTLNELDDALKYSTVTLSRVEIKHGNEVHTYAVKNAETLRRAPAVAAETGDELDIAEMPESFEFVDDGYVKYTMVYANTADFNMEEKVNVVLMPQVPVKKEITKISHELTPSKNAELWYRGYIYDPNSNKAKRYTEASDIDTWTKTDEPATVSRSDAKNIADNQIYIVDYKSVKDISELVGEGENPYLESDTETIGYNVDGLSGVEDIIAGSNDGTVEYFNLQGIRMNEPLAPGVYIRSCGGSAEKVYIK